MSDQSIFKRYVQVGRVVLLSTGPYEGKLAAIVEIIDHNRALIDGPLSGVPRQAVAYRKLVLTPHVLKNLPRATGAATVAKHWKKDEIDAKWEKSAWAKKRAATQKRIAASDYERFQIKLARQTRARSLGKALKAAKKA